MKIDDAFSNNLALLGLSDYELKIFAAASQLGSAGAAQLAKKANIPRPSVYPVLETLSQKGLVSVEKRKGASRFIPASPDRLVTLAEERLAEAQASLKVSKQVAEALRSSKGRDALSSAKILLFEGRKSIEQMLYEWEAEWLRSILEHRGEWIGFQDAAFLKHYGKWVIDHWEKYGEAKGFERYSLKLISEETFETKQVGRAASSYAGERRQLKPLPTKFAFSASLWVMGEYVVALKTRTEPHYAIQIRDEVLAENMAAVFQFMWELVD